ncbi:MAG: sugar phosphate isomerase/epimerase family protein [Pseudomonadota bacterium]
MAEASSPLSPALPPALPLVGAAIQLKDLKQVDGLHAFIRDESRDLEIQDYSLPHVIAGDLAPVIARSREAVDGHHGRIGIHGPFFGWSLATNDADVRAIVRKRLMSALDALLAFVPDPAKAHMVVHSPIGTWAYFNDPKDPGAAEKKIERTHAALRDVLAKAADHGLTLVLENIEDRDPAALVKMVETIDHPALALSLDTGHANYAHGALGGPPPDYFARAFGRRLAHVHLQDTDGYADRHWQLGTGSICWRAVMEAIAEAADAPRLLIEMRQARDILPSVRYLQELGLVR